MFFQLNYSWSFYYSLSKKKLRKQQDDLQCIGNDQSTGCSCSRNAGPVVWVTGNGVRKTIFLPLHSIIISSSSENRSVRYQRHPAEKSQSVWTSFVWISAMNFHHSLILHSHPRILYIRRWSRWRVQLSGTVAEELSLVGGINSRNILILTQLVVASYLTARGNPIRKMIDPKKPQNKLGILVLFSFVNTSHLFTQNVTEYLKIWLWTWNPSSHR